MRPFQPSVDLPTVRFEKCSECEEMFTNLSSNGLCQTCAGELRQIEEIKSLSGRREELLRGCGVPKRFRRMRFVEPSPWPTDHLGRDVASCCGERWAVTFAGEVGTGKTMLAVELLWRDLLRCLRGGARASHQFVRAVDAVRIAFERGEGRGSLSQLTEARFLVLDDLGAGISGDAWTAMDRVLGNRYDEERPTVVTTNLGARGMAEKHDSGARIVDRLRDGLWVNLTGDSRRG